MCGRRKSLRKSGSGKIQQQFEKLCRNQATSQVLCQSRFSVNFGCFWDFFWKAKSGPNPSWKPSWEPEWFQSCPKFKLKGAQDGIATDRPVIRSKSRSKTSFILGPVFGRFQVQFRPTPRPHWQSKPTSVTGTAELNIRTAWTAPADGVQTQVAKYLWCFWYRFRNESFLIPFLIDLGAQNRPKASPKMMKNRFHMRQFYEWFPKRFWMYVWIDFSANSISCIILPTRREPRKTLWFSNIFISSLVWSSLAWLVHVFFVWILLHPKMEQKLAKRKPKTMSKSRSKTSLI